MNVGIYIPKATIPKGWERNISAHIQIPMKTCELLERKGIHVHLVTNKYTNKNVFPACTPNVTKVHLVDDGKIRKNNQPDRPKLLKGINPIKIWLLLFQLKKIARKEKLDVFHFFGNYQTAILAGVLNLIGLKAKVISTLSGGINAKTNLVEKKILQSINLLASTEYVANEYSALGFNFEVLKHGVVRNFENEEGYVANNIKSRVLFWREGTKKNGADICIQAYRELATKYKDISFDFAIRSYGKKEVEGLGQIEKKHPNVNIYRFPYKNGITLAKLLSEAICVVLPFQKLSTDPQFAVAESLALGIPVITTNIRSNNELIIPGINGDLIDTNDPQALTKAIDNLLAEKEHAKLSEKAKELYLRNWNWNGYIDKLLTIYS